MHMQISKDENSQESPKACPGVRIERPACGPPLAMLASRLWLLCDVQESSFIHKVAGAGRQLEEQSIVEQQIAKLGCESGGTSSKLRMD